MHREETISSALQMYLKTILQLQTDNHVARVKEIAEKLDVTGATVSSAVKTLEERGLVNHARYGYITLTPDGEHLARCVLRRFEVLKQFLAGVLQVSSATADADACLMEHDVSPQTLDRLASFCEFLQANEQGRQVIARFADSVRTALPVQTLPARCGDCLEVGTCRISGSV